MPTTRDLVDIVHGWRTRGFIEHQVWESIKEKVTFQLPEDIPRTQPTAQQPFQQLASQPVPQQAAQPMVQPTVQPMVQQAAQPMVQPTQPLAQPTAQLMVQPTQPMVQPAAQPLVQPTAQPMVQPAMQLSTVSTTNGTTIPITGTVPPTAQPSAPPEAQPRAQQTPLMQPFQGVVQPYQSAVPVDVGGFPFTPNPQMAAHYPGQLAPPYLASHVTQQAPQLHPHLIGQPRFLPQQFASQLNINAFPAAFPPQPEVPSELSFASPHLAHVFAQYMHQATQPSPNRPEPVDLTPERK